MRRNRNRRHTHRIPKHWSTIVRGRRGGAPVSDQSSNIHPMLAHWPEYCHPCPCPACYERRVRLDEQEAARLAPEPYE